MENKNLIIYKTLSEPFKFGIEEKGLDGKKFLPILEGIQNKFPNFELPIMFLFKDGKVFIPSVYQQMCISTLTSINFYF